MNIIIIIIITIITFIFPTSAYAADLSAVNQKVCNRFEEDTARLAAIMDELRDRNGIKETRVAFGGSDTPIKQADYWINYAAEAIAYQRAQKLTNEANLKASLRTLAGKVLRAKTEVGKALDEE